MQDAGGRGDYVLGEVYESSLLNFVVNLYVYAQSSSCVRLFGTPWTVAHQAPLSMGFSSQEYLSGLPFLPPGIFPPRDQTCISYVSCIGRQVLYY